MRLGRAAGLLGCLAALLQGCVTGIAQVGAIVAGMKASYDFAGEITTGTSAALKAQCVVWNNESKKADARVADGTSTAAGAKGASALRPYLDATCDPNAPPPADPAGAVIWVAGLTLRVHSLTGGQPVP